MNNKKTVMTTFAVLLALVFAPGFALAAEPGEANITGEQDRGEFIFTATDQTIDLESGNITEANLTTEMSTYRWTGLFGTASGDIVLGDAADNVLFDWTAVGRTVFASTAASVAWASLAAASAADIETAFPFTNTGSDNATGTFAGTAALNTGLFNIAGAARALTYDNTGTPTWETLALDDAGTIVFAGPVQSSGTAYSGDTVDYQMILPEDGTGFNAAPQAYNLWVELE